MSSETTELDRMRRAFAEAADAAGAGALEPVDTELIWRVANGDADPSEIRELADRAAEDAEVAEAWRLALATVREVRAATHSSPEARVVPFRRRYGRLLTLAAGIAICLAVPSLMYVRSQHEQPVRGERTTAPSSLLEAPAELPRGAFELRWTPGSPGSTYDVVVTTVDLVPIDRARGLAHPEFVVPAERLASVESGTTLLWRVTLRHGDGASVESPTFTAIVR